MALLLILINFGAKQFDKCKCLIDKQNNKRLLTSGKPSAFALYFIYSIVIIGSVFRASQFRFSCDKTDFGFKLNFPPISFENFSKQK